MKSKNEIHEKRKIKVVLQPVESSKTKFAENQITKHIIKDVDIEIERQLCK